MRCGPAQVFRRVVLLLVVVLSVAGCRRQSDTRGNAFVVAQASEPRSLDPHVATSLNDFRIIENVFEGLVRFKPGSLDIEPSLAKSWTISPDGLTYTFQLRDGVRFHDGSAFDANAVKFSFDRMLNPGHPSHDTGPFPLSFFFSKIESITVEDPTCVVFRLKEPFAPFLANLAYPTGSIVSPTALAGDGRHGFGRRPSGTGPFCVVDWEANNFVRLKPNEDWWKGPPPALDVYFRPITDENARIASLLAGESDVVLEVPADLIAHFRNKKGYQVLEQSGPHVWFLIFNTREGVFRDKRVRQAVNLSINRDAIVRDLLQGTATAASGPLPAAFGPEFEPAGGVSDYNPDKARRLLRDAGAVGAKVKLLATEGGSGMLDPKTMAMAIQADLALVGLQVEIETYEWNTFLKMVNSGLEGKADMAQMAWMTNDPDTLPYLTLRSESWPERGGFNSGYYSNPGVDELIERARREVDKDERTRLYLEMQRLVRGDAPCAYVASWRQNAVVSSRVFGLAMEPSFLFRLDNVMVSDPREKMP